MNAYYNLGCFYLSNPMNSSQSFSKAYDMFKIAAEKGHTISAFNIAIMHFLGIGTYKSCTLA
jgi:TPR repeat protein